MTLHPNFVKEMAELRAAVNLVAALSEAQKAFLLDPRPYVKGGDASPAVRTMRSLERRELISVEAIPCGGRTSYATTLTEIGRRVVKVMQEHPAVC